MGLKCTLPGEMARVVAEHTGTKAPPRFCIGSDLTLNRHYGQSYLAVVDHRVVVCDSQGQVLSFDLADITERHNGLWSLEAEQYLQRTCATQA